MQYVSLAISAVSAVIGVTALVTARRSYHRALNVIRDRETWR